MKVELAEMQQKMAARSHRSPEVPEEQKEQAEAKVENRAERQAEAEAAVSVITDALQQHAISTGGRQPTPAPAAAGATDLAALLHSAAAHFGKGCQSSGSASGTAPAHAPVSGTPQAQAHATAAPNCEHRGEATAIGDVAWRSCRQKDRTRDGREGSK